MERTYSHIDMDERRKIARWRMAGISVDHIAAKLGRHRSTIFREVKRNTFVDPQMPDLNGYYCVTAQDMARDRRRVGKLFRREDLQTAVIGKLGAGWSPEQIAGRLKIEPKAKARVCHETIYRYVYVLRSVRALAKRHF